MKIQEFVDKYKEDYLKGKSQAERDAFLAKDLKRQYGNLQAWRRRHITKAQREVIPVEDIINNIRCAAIHVRNMTDASEKQLAKLEKALGELSRNIADFHEIRRSRLIDELLRQKQEIDRQISELSEF